MIAPPSKISTRVTALALAIAFLVSAAFGVTAYRLSTEQDRVDALARHAAQLEAELDDLRSRLGQASGGPLDAIASAVAKLRGLAFKSRVNATVLTEAELRKRVATEIETEAPREEVEKDAKVLRALGLLTPQQDLYRILLEVQTEQIGGYYDSEAKQMVVGGDAKSPSPLSRTLLAHEYTHALTDQHFDLGRLEELREADQDDEAEAYLSLVEGDATLLMGVYAREALTEAEQVALGREAAGISSEKLDAAPKALRTALLFPYEAGLRFARALFERGGNAALDRAYRDPPASTEQILHPERYYGRRDDPVAVRLPDLAKAMGSGWTEIRKGGAGELDMRLILGQFLASSDTNAAAAGWDGGSYVAVEGSAGVVVAVQTAWDSITEAREAEDAFRDWLPDRFERKGSPTRISGADGAGWESPDGAAQVIRAGDRLLVIVGPTTAVVERARAAMKFGSQTA